MVALDAVEAGLRLQEGVRHPPFGHGRIGTPTVYPAQLGAHVAEWVLDAVGGQQRYVQRVRQAQGMYGQQAGGAQAQQPGADFGGAGSQTEDSSASSGPKANDDGVIDADYTMMDDNKKKK